MKKFVYIYRPPQSLTPVVKQLSDIPHQFDLTIPTEEEQYYESVCLQGTAETITLLSNMLFPNESLEKLKEDGTESFN